MLLGLFEFIRQLILLLLVELILFNLEKNSIVLEIQCITNRVALASANLLLFFVMSNNIPYGADEYFTPEFIVHHLKEYIRKEFGLDCAAGVKLEFIFDCLQTKVYHF